MLFKTFKIHFFPPLLFVVLPSLLGAFLLDRFNKKTLKFSLQSSSLFSLLLTSLFPICSLLLLQTKHIKSYVLYLFILFFLLILIHFIKNLFNFKYAAILLGLLCWYTAIEQLDQNHYKYELFFKWPEKELLEILDTNNSSDTILLFPASHLLMGARKNPQTHSFYFRTWPIEILLGKEGVSRELKKIKDSNFRFWVAHEKIEIPEEFESIKNCSLVFKKILNYKRHGNTLIYDCKDYH